MEIENTEKTRRQFLATLIGANLLLLGAYISTKRTSSADDLAPFQEWLVEVNKLSLALKLQNVSQAEWRNQIVELIGKIDKKRLLKFSNFSELDKQIAPRLDKRVFIGISPMLGYNAPESFFNQCYMFLPPGGEVPLHGHNCGRATFLYTVKGHARVEHYNRIYDDASRGSVFIQPTQTVILSPGASSTTTPQHENVHRITNIGDSPVVFFNIDTDRIGEGRTNVPAPIEASRVYLDERNLKLFGTYLEAPIVEFVKFDRLYLRQKS